MPTILATDYDGTLNLGGFLPHVTDAIRRFREAGGLFGVVTGRCWRWGWNVFRQEEKFMFDFVIMNNGALAADYDGNVLFETKADGRAPVNGKPLVYALTEGAWELSEGGIFSYINGPDRRYFHPSVPNGGVFDGDECAPMGEIDDFMDGFHMGFIGCGSMEQGTAVAAALRERFGAWVNPLQSGRCVDIPPAGVDKAAGIRRYAQMMGAAETDIWTAGDHYNDIAMLQAFNSCAMESGVSAAKEAAKYVKKDIGDVISFIMG